MIQQAPKQYTLAGNLVKRFLHTKLGAFIGYHLGISGYNKLDVTLERYISEGVYKKESFYSFNSRTDIGASVTASRMAGSTLGTATSPQAPLYIALSTATLTPAKTDTTLASETVVAGLGRALATAGTYTAPATLDGACSYVLTKAFTLTGAPTTIVSAGIFDAVSTGNLFVEANLSSSAVMSTNDILTINWTINL